MKRLYVARDPKATVVTRHRNVVGLRRPVRRSWTALVETDAAPVASWDLAKAIVPPIAALGLVTPVFGAPAGASTAAVVFLGTSYLGPLVRARRAKRAPKPRAETFVLTAPGDRSRFAAAVAVADRISETWPVLGDQVDVPAAEQVLADALWEIAEGLARRHQLAEVLAGLSRPEFAAAQRSEQTARELHEHLIAARAALTDAEAGLAVSENDLSRAEQACQALVREEELRAAMRVADESLRTPPPS